MTDLASLKLAIDSTDVKSGVTALDGLTAAGKKTTAEVNRLERALKEEAISADRAAKGLVTASSAAGKLRLEQSLAANAAEKVTSATTKATATMSGLGKMSGATRAHMQNLTFQLNDVAVGLASGQKPMTVFMQQGAQIAQIAMMAEGGLAGLTKQLGSMVLGFLRAHPVMLAVAAIAGTAALAMAGLTKELNAEKKGELDAYAASLGLTAKELRELGPITIGVTDLARGYAKAIAEEFGINIPNVLAGLAKAFGTAFDAAMTYSKVAAASIYAAWVGQITAIKQIWSNFPAIIGEATYGAANLAIKALNWLLQKGADYVNAWSGLVNRALAKIPGFSDLKIPTVDAPKVSELGNPYAGATANVGKAIVSSVESAYGDAMAAFGRIGRKGGEYAADSAKQGFRDRAQAKGFLDEEAAKGSAGKAGKAAGDKFAEEMAKAIEAGTKAARFGLEQASFDFNKNMAAFWDQSDSEAMEQMGRNLDALQKPARDLAATTALNAEAAAYWNEQLKQTVGYLDQIGGFGSSLGNIGAIMASLGDKDPATGNRNFSGVNGRVGGVLNLFNQTDTGRKFINMLGDKLDDVFGGAGSFSKAMRNVLGNAAIGGLVGGGGVGPQIGGALGGALGSKLAPAVGKAIGGAVGGVIGAAIPIIGSIIGGLIGGLFKKAKTGSASVTQGGISIGGNNNDAKGNTGSIGGSVQGSLGKIIQALGGTAGSYGFSIGQREDEFRVSGSAGADVTGKNPSGLLYRGKSAEEAARIALLNAINDGAVAGIREGASNLLKSGKDLESALAKALKFNAVFDELAKEADPVKFAMDAVGKELADLKAIFDEAGASASDYAALEELSAIKRAKTYNEIIAPQRDLEIEIMRLEGKELEATAAERAMELAGLNASLRPLQERIYALTDEAAAQAQATQALEQATATAKALNNERLGMEATLLDLTGDKAGALAIRRALEISAMDESLRSLQLQIYAQQDVAAARDVLNSAYQRERSELTATADKFTSLANSLRAFRATLYAGESGSSLASLRATGNMAALGSESAIGSLPGVASSFLASSRLTSSSLNDYKRDVARVATIVDRAIGGADGMASAAQQQLAALDKSVEGLLEVKESVITVEQAIADLREAMAVPTLAIADTAIKAREEDKQAAVDLLKEVAAMREENRTLNLKTVENTATMARFLARVDAAGVRVFNDNSGPIYTTAAV